MSLYRRFRANIKRENWIESGDAILCGVSGGVDSMVLASLLVQLKKDIPFHLSLAHVNYGLRGKESDDQEKLVSDFAKRHGLKCFTTKAPLSKKEGENFQKMARDFRYHYFAEMALQAGANKVAVAHHMEDQVETILGHLLRGSNLRGLSGMRDTSALFVTPAKAGVQSRLDPGFRRNDAVTLIRPLLSFSKESLQLHASQNNILYIDDSSNTSPKYWRNRLRQELLPVIQNLKPQSFGKIIRLGRIFQEVSQYLGGEARIWIETYAKQEESQFWFPRPAFIVLPHLLRLEILRWAFVLYSGSGSQLKEDHLVRCEQICLSAKSKGSYRLSKGIQFVRQGDDLLLRKGS